MKTCYEFPLWPAQHVAHYKNQCVIKKALVHILAMMSLYLLSNMSQAGVDDPWQKKNPDQTERCSSWQ